MRYFTDNPLERLMMQVPGQQRERKAPAAPKDLRCSGCANEGKACAKPCPKDKTQSERRTTHAPHHR